MTTINVTEPTIQIEHFIFHVVHNKDEDPILMDETPLGDHGSFFIERIKEVMGGNQFTFKSDSTFLEQVRDLDKKPGKFVDISKEFAKTFHKKDGRIKEGVMILIRVKIDKVRKYVLLKYDHEAVVYYSIKQHTAILKELSNTFSKNKSALQKSAIIDISSDTENPSAIVIDNSDRIHVTDFFKNFLGISRKYSTEKLTERAYEAFKETVKYHRPQLPREITSNVTDKFNRTAQNQKKFDPEEFIKAALGADYIPEMGERFKKELKSKDISGESFKFDKTIPSPPYQRYKTDEGIVINVPQNAANSINFEVTNRKTVITITTERYHEE